MPYTLLLETISKYITLSKEEEDFLARFLKEKRVRKRQFLLQEEEVQTSSIFVTEGCLRSYALDNNGFEHVLQFAPPGWWIGDMNSLQSGKAGMLYIDAIFDSRVILLSKADQEIIYQTFPKFERFFRIIAERALAAAQCRMVNHLSLPAIERYGSFCTLYPSLIECLPQKQIASFIGVTPEFLSSILRKTTSPKESNT